MDSFDYLYTKGPLKIKTTSRDAVSIEEWSQNLDRILGNILVNGRPLFIVDSVSRARGEDGKPQ